MPRAATRDPEVRCYFVANGYAYHHSIDVNDFYLPAIEAVPAGLLDGARYLKHLAFRRVARTRQLLRRAWHKHVLGRPPQ